MRKQLLIAALMLPTLALAQDTTKTTQTTTTTPTTSTATTQKTEKQKADGTSSTVVEQSSKNDASGLNDKKTTKVTVDKNASGAVTKTKVEETK